MDGFNPGTLVPDTSMGIVCFVIAQVEFKMKFNYALPLLTLLSTIHARRESLADLTRLFSLGHLLSPL